MKTCCCEPCLRIIKPTNLEEINEIMEITAFPGRCTSGYFGKLKKITNNIMSAYY